MAQFPIYNQRVGISGSHKSNQLTLPPVSTALGDAMVKYVKQEQQQEEKLNDVRLRNQINDGINLANQENQSPVEFGNSIYELENTLSEGQDEYSKEKIHYLIQTQSESIMNTKMNQQYKRTNDELTMASNNLATESTRQIDNIVANADFDDQTGTFLNMEKAQSTTYNFFKAVNQSDAQGNNLYGGTQRARMIGEYNGQMVESQVYNQINKNGVGALEDIRNMKIMQTDEIGELYVTTIGDQLDEKQIYDLESKLRTQTKQSAEKKAVLAEYELGAKYDPKNSGDKKKVEAIYQHNITEDMTPDQVLNQGVGLAIKTGIMVDDVKRTVRAGLRSGNQQEALIAAQTMRAIEQGNPRVIGDFANDDIEMGVMINSSIDAGYTPAQAYNRAKEVMNVTPQIKSARKEDYKAMMDEDKSFIKNTIDKEFETSVFFGSDYEIPTELRQQFAQQIEQEYLRTGNIDSASKAAAIQLSKIYGKTEVNGKKTFMRNAPEQVYGIQGVDNAKWIKDQLVKEINTNLASPLPEDRVMLSPSNKVDANGLPLYTVTTIGDDGVLYNIGKVFQPDYTQTEEYKFQQEGFELIVEEAMKEREALIDIKNGESPLPYIVSKYGPIIKEYGRFVLPF